MQVTLDTAEHSTAIQEVEKKLEIKSEQLDHIQKEMQPLKYTGLENRNLTKRLNEMKSLYQDQVCKADNLENKFRSNLFDYKSVNKNLEKIAVELDAMHTKLNNENDSLKTELQKMKTVDDKRGSKALEELASMRSLLAETQVAFERRLASAGTEKVRVARMDSRDETSRSHERPKPEHDTPMLAIYKINSLSSNARVEQFDGPDIPNRLTKIRYREGYKILTLSSNPFFRSYKVWARLKDEELDELKATPLLKIRRWNSSTTPKKNNTNLEGRMMIKRIVIKDNKLTLDQQLGVKNKIADQVRRNTGQKIDKIESKVLQSDTIFTVLFTTQTDKARRHIYEMRLSDMLGNMFHNKTYIFSWWKNFNRGDSASSEEGLLRRFIRLVRQ